MLVISAQFRVPVSPAGGQEARQVVGTESTHCVPVSPAGGQEAMQVVGTEGTHCVSHRC